MSWEFSDWGSLASILGLIISLGTLFYARLINNDVQRLKTGFIFDQRIADHIDKLKKNVTNLKDLLRSYQDQISEIRESLALNQTELESLKIKLGKKQRKRTNKIIGFIAIKRSNQFKKTKREDGQVEFYIKKIVPQFFKTSYNDVWLIYEEIHGLINEVENYKQDKDKSL